MSKRNDPLLVADIAESIEKIQIYVQDLDLLAFSKDDKTKDAVVRNLAIIGEAVNKLSETFTSQHTAIEWRKIAAFRNRLIHEYFGVDYDVVWLVIHQDLQVLAQYLATLEE